MLAVAMLGAALLLSYLTRREGLPGDAVLLAAVVAVVAAFVGSRVLYFLANSNELDTLSSATIMRRGGLFAYGAFVGAVVAGWLVLRARKVNPLPVADAAAPCFALMLMVTRLGCYGFGCDFGVPLSDGAPGWLKKLGTFPHWPDGTLLHGAGAPAWVQHVKERGLSPVSSASLPVHPTQLYEVLIGALLLWACFAARPWQRFRGQIFLQLVLAYGACRFGLEVLRDDAERGSVPPALPEHLLVAAGFAALGGAAAIWVAPIVADLTVRRIVQAAALLPALVAFVLLRPSASFQTARVELSVSQLFALATGIGAAYAFSRLHRAALAHPEAAMALDPKGAEPAEARPRKKRRKKARRPPP
jgi:phosphatidylglycerol:prolipoprotein diacylglycerol transferase